MSKPMIEIGKYNTLEVIKETDFGIYVGDEVEEILMPTKWVPEGTEVGDMIEVFIYNDSEDRMIATTMVPKITLNTFAFLEARQVTSIGAFMDWGLHKDLLVPFKEQLIRMEAGKSYMVYMYLDEVTDRLVGSSHVNKFVEKESIDLEVGQEVSLLIYQDTDLGYKAIIDNKYQGLVYRNEIFSDVAVGMATTGYVKTIREDNKIDVSLQKVGFEAIGEFAEKIMETLKQSDGTLALHDKSSPEEIHSKLKMSKKNFKKAVGTLYKQRLVDITDAGIQLMGK